MIKIGNHKRVKIYKVALAKGYDTFCIGPNLLYENELKFVYNVNGVQEEKIVPISYWAQYLSNKPKKLIYYDELNHDKVYKGEFYLLPAHTIISY